MKLVLVLSILLLSGCSTYGTHVRTGCVWSCDEWQQKLAEGQTNYASGSVATGPGQTAHTYNLPNASYMVIRSGSTTSVIQTSKTR